MKKSFGRLLLASSPWLLGLCVLLWIGSYLPDDFHVRSDHSRVCLIFCANQHSRDFGTRDGQGIWTTDAILQEARTWQSSDRKIHLRGFGFEFIAHDMQWGFLILVLPYWAIFLPLAAATFYYLRNRRRWDRQRQGLCTKCGYDLRATPDRCPECGTIPAKSNV